MSRPDDDHPAAQSVASPPESDFRNEDKVYNDVLFEALLEEAAREVAERAVLVQPINSIKLTRFKQYLTLDLVLNPNLTLMAGSNNSGKSSILHALAVWEFCRLATTMERGGVAGLHPNRVGVQGFGIGDDEFSPINIPSLKHLWTNLKPGQKNPGQDGYTLKIGIQWTTGIGLKNLTFGLSLANDRLFIRVDASNLAAGDVIPRIAFLPPFAGISAHEQRVSGAVRRRRIGEGLAGAVLRNLLLDLQQENVRKRLVLRNSGFPLVMEPASIRRRRCSRGLRVPRRVPAAPGPGRC